MKTLRNLFIVVILAASCLLPTQSVGAASVESGPGSPACDDIGPIPYRFTALGVGSPAGATLLVAPACMNTAVPADDAADNQPLACQAFGPMAVRFVPVAGLSVAGAGTSMAIPACMASFDLAGTAAVPDVRMCQVQGAVPSHLHACALPD